MSCGTELPSTYSHTKDGSETKTFYCKFSTNCASKNLVSAGAYFLSIIEICLVKAAGIIYVVLFRRQCYL